MTCCSFSEQAPPLFSAAVHADSVSDMHFCLLQPETSKRLLITQAYLSWHFGSSCFLIPASNATCISGVQGNIHREIDDPRFHPERDGQRFHQGRWRWRQETGRAFWSDVRECPHLQVTESEGVWGKRADTGQSWRRLALQIMVRSLSFVFTLS